MDNCTHQLRLVAGGTGRITSLDLDFRFTPPLLVQKDVERLGALAELARMVPDQVQVFKKCDYTELMTYYGNHQESSGLGQS